MKGRVAWVFPQSIRTSRLENSTGTWFLAFLKEWISFWCVCAQQLDRNNAGSVQYRLLVVSWPAMPDTCNQLAKFTVNAVYSWCGKWGKWHLQSDVCTIPVTFTLNYSCTVETIIENKLLEGMENFPSIVERRIHRRTISCVHSNIYAFRKSRHFYTLHCWSPFL